MSRTIFFLYSSNPSNLGFLSLGIGQNEGPFFNASSNTFTSFFFFLLTGFKSNGGGLHSSSLDLCADLPVFSPDLGPDLPVSLGGD